MEKKYPVLKCNEELWDEIKPVLESFGVTDFSGIGNSIISKFDEYPFLVSNYGRNSSEEFCIGNIDVSEINEYGSLRYIVSTKEEFLSAVAKLLGKEYPIKEENKQWKKKKSKSSIENVNLADCNDNEVFNKALKQAHAISHDPAVGESSTVAAAIPPKGNYFDKDKGSDLDKDKNKDMEKINIVDKLRYCKKGTKLYSPLFGEVELIFVENKLITIKTIKGVNACFNNNGEYHPCYPDAECLLFPSKDNRDWNNFQVLESGHHVMVSDDTHNWCLRLYVTDNKTIHFNSDDDKDEMTWKYIVPVEDFDFTAEDITVNKEKSIV
mgnify:CR=1 FL=1